MTSRRARLEAFLAGATVFVVSAVALTVTERSASDAVVQQARLDLVGFARMAAASMSAQQHQDLLGTGRMDSSTYRAVSEPLLRLRGAVPEIYYAYTLVRTPEGLRFGVDSSAFIKNPGDDTPVARLRQPYPDAPPAALRTFRSGQAQASRSTYTDDWGTFLSAYAPFPPGGPSVVGVVGVDLSLADLQRRLYPLRLALVLALSASAGASILVGYRRFQAASRRLQDLEVLEQGRIQAEQTAAAALAANRAKSTFLATISHELRTPLNGILGMTAHALAGELVPETRECIETAQTSAEALLSSLNDILTFSSLEAGELRLALQSVPLRPFLEEILTGFADQARSKGLELRLLPPDSLDSIWTGPNGMPRCLRTDPDHLRRVLGHLLDNAIKFSSHGEVVVAATCAPGSDAGEGLLEVAVSDQGPALLSPRLDELFQPFVQADGSNTRRHGGLGLGLVIVQRLVTALGGRIAVESEPGVGSTFRLTLPGLEPLSSPAPVPPQASGPELVPPAEATAEDPRGPDERAALTVLVAEDSAVNRRVCELMFARLGHQVTFAMDGLEAVRLQESLDPDLIVMDLQMPHLDGIGATEQIRRHCADEVHPWIVALTAGGQPSDREQALAAGMNDFLTKPLRLESLRDALSRAEKARQGNQGDVLKSGSRFSRKALRPS